MEAAGRLNRNGAMCYLGNYREGGGWEDFHKDLYAMVLGSRLVFGSVNSSKGHFQMGLRDMAMIRNRFGDILGKLIAGSMPPGSIGPSGLKGRTSRR